MKKIKWYIYVIAVLGAIIIALVIFGSRRDDDRDIYEEELKRQYDAKVNESNQRLAESVKSRIAANYTIDSLYRVNKVIFTSDSISKAELARVPGKFQNLNSKQLQDKMIEEYESR